MELALNLVWVAVAIAAILAQIAACSHDTALARRPVSHSRKIIAMGCTLVILFFVISMTDDLHDQQILLEEKRVSLSTSGTETKSHLASARPAPIGFLLFCPPLAYSTGLLAVRRAIETSEFLRAVAIDHENLCSRAPPFSLA